MNEILDWKFAHIQGRHEGKRIWVTSSDLESAKLVAAARLNVPIEEIECIYDPTKDNQCL